MPNILLEIVSIVIPVMFLIVVWAIPLYRFNRRKTIPRIMALHEDDVPSDMRDFLSKSDHQLLEMGFRPVGGLEATGDAGEINTMYFYMSVDDCHEASVCRFKSGDTVHLYSQITTGLSPHGCLNTIDGGLEGFGLDNPTKDNITIINPSVEEISTVYEYHVAFCEEATNQHYQFVAQSPSEFIDRLETALRNNFERQVKGGWMARNADGSYRWTFKKAILWGPMLFFPLWTVLLSWLPKPNKEKLRKRVAARLAKAKTLPPEERTHYGRAI